MFDLSWGELLIIGVVALIILGPKDLVGMFRTLGRMTGKVRRMAREFQKAMEDAADEAGVKDAVKDVKGMTNPSKMGLDKLNEAASRFDKWDPTKPSKKAADIGEETAKLSEERAEAARKIKEYSASKTIEKQAAESAAARAAEAEKGTDAQSDTGPDPKPEDSA